MSKGLNGKVAIVTGGAGGIGRASVEALAAAGAKVAIADLNFDSAASAAEEIRKTGADVIPVQVDVADEASVEAMIKTVKDAYGRIDVLYNNAAALGEDMSKGDRDVLNMDTAVWDKAMAVNVKGPMLCTKYALPSMIEQGGGSIIYASSGMGFQGEITRSAYAASKAAVAMLAKSVATQYGKQGVRSNAIQIGYLPPVNSLKFTPPEVSELLCNHNLIPHHLRPEHIAEVVVFLASDAAAAVTGHTLAADGGFSAHTPSMNDMIQFARKAGQSSI